VIEQLLQGLYDVDASLVMYKIILLFHR